MASFTGVGDNTTIQMALKGEDVTVAISGTYDMTIALQRELGSPNSGAWVTLKSWDTANATVAYTHRTTTENEKLRLIVLVDTSGTATATLTDAQSEINTPVTIKDPLGNTLVEFSQDCALFAGGVTPGSPVNVTANLTLTRAKHGGKVLVFNVASGATITLPAASGSGTIYRFAVNTTVTSNNYVIQVANTTDIIQGGVLVATDTGGLTVPTAGTDDTITMNGSTTGGVKGSYIEIMDVAAGLFVVRGFIVSTGVEATPFSAAV